MEDNYILEHVIFLNINFINILYISFLGRQIVFTVSSLYQWNTQVTDQGSKMILVYIISNV